MEDMETEFQISEIDYSDPSGWMLAETNGQCPVDAIWVYPTVVIKGSLEGKYAPIDDILKNAAKANYRIAGSCLEECANMYIPFYHQIAQEHLREQGDHDGLIRAEFEGRGYAEICRALDYYFEHYNNGKPFILAGHSQSSAILYSVMAVYMKEHPEYLERMVAAYILGFAFTKDYFERNKHLKFAEGENDTGCIISWNTEGPGGAMPSNVLTEGALAINPLNWKTDGTPADASINRGGFRPIVTEAGPVACEPADAAIDTKRGVVVCTTIKDYLPGVAHAAFGDKSLHLYDWSAYYMNIRENARKRIEAYLKAH